MAMNKTCPVCGQSTEMEVGFYYGTSYVSYVLTIVISVLSLLLWWLIIGCVSSQIGSFDTKFNTMLIKILMS